MKRLFAAAALLASLQPVFAGEMSLYSQPDFRGSEVTVRDAAPNFRDFGFNDRASSIVVHSGSWEVCEHKNFGGYCAVLRPGEYADLRRFNNAISSAREVERWRDRGDGRWDDDRGGWRGDGRDGREAWREGREERREERRGWHGGPGIELFAAPRFGGESVGLTGDTRTLRSMGFNDRAGSLIVREGEWEVCEHADYRGRCAVFGPGSYPFLGDLNNEVSSARRLR
ncbi:beta/gamma crystallin [Pseudoduganella flava]|nr:beta/gamma crystallin-related protein [Pseudoduganella flava]TWI51654.1 beta/gamma crystallin [Pseudoduganella flava]